MLVLNLGKLSSLVIESSRTDLGPNYSTQMANEKVRILEDE